MKGLALNIIWAIVIALASLFVLLSLMGTFKVASNWFYCNVYIGISNFFTGEENAPVPDFCKHAVSDNFEIVNIDKSDNKIFSRILLAHIIACWKNSETLGLYENHPCYEIHLINTVNNVTEQNVSDILINEDHCKSIENVDYGCGARNQILWNIEGSVWPFITPTDISDAINSITEPSPVPVNDTMFTITPVNKKIELKNLLSSDIPEQICASTGCSFWEHKKTTNSVKFIIGSGIYSYDIDLVLSYLERNGLINSVINDQKIILIEYNGAKDAVEVIG